MMPPTLVGATIDGKYRVERVLGQGGMGVVVAARHLRLGELVAIKFPLSTARLRDDSVERLLREARAAMRVRSEHVARVHDVGLHPSAGPYLVMEYLVGRDLGTVLAQDGPLPAHLAVEYVLQACEALAEAHARGIVHRDLKPSNLFLSRRADGDPHIKVIDFGLAKTHQDEGQVNLTKSGAMLGSPLFMAPEQMRGSAGVDARADIWALGATLFALLTGKPPFPGKTLLDVYDMLKLGPPELAVALPDVATALQAAVHGCLVLEPSARHATIADFAEHLAQARPSDATRSTSRIRRILENSGAKADANIAGEDSNLLVAAAAPADEQTQAVTAGALTASWRDESTSAGRPRVETGASLSLSARANPSGNPWRALGVIVGLPVAAGIAFSFWRAPSTSKPIAQPGARLGVASYAATLPTLTTSAASSSALPRSEPSASPLTGVAPAVSASPVRPRSVRATSQPQPTSRPEAVRDPLADPD